MSSGLSINLTKSSLLIISRCHTKPQLSITINSTPVTIAEPVKYLGVTIAPDLKWNTHITNTCKSAKQKLGLLYRNFHLADQKTLSQLYKALVLPMLEYCSCIWDPPSITLSDKLESIPSSSKSKNSPPSHSSRSICQNCLFSILLLYPFVNCGTASLRKLSLYHLLVHLRLPCCSYHHLLYDVLLSVFLPCSVYMCN